MSITVEVRGGKLIAKAQRKNDEMLGFQWVKGVKIKKI